MQRQLISIVMPAKDSAATIESSIFSVLAQTYKNFELLICDDGSTDSTIQIIKSFNDSRIKLIKNNIQSGAWAARNSCINEASGKYIAFLDSDDLWAPAKLETQLNFMHANNISFSYGDYHIFNSSDIAGTFKAPNSVSYVQLCRKCDIGCLTVMLNASAIDKVVMPNIKKEDYATWLKILKHEKITAYRYPGVLASYRIGDKSLSSNKLIEITRQYNVLRSIAELSFIKSALCISIYAFSGIYKHLFKYKKHEY
ncbi:glycosyltransferase family 2 protein [Paraglaciecola aquimarina]|uniref:Glycosyltransferase family 2 protein n=1 Tax=Paraglaciecola algarum TaxID=3050085 RepID=A0ABS9D9X8_9ALTE|nr:glycosyltransferase family 2 protein [Paraglaciecola sp. G1-23]MCF2948431.1 glycosyltransferase family 2 protein [Paraglaciecola sp. G1-23]